MRNHSSHALPEDAHATAELLVAVEAAKRRLSTMDEVELPLPGARDSNFTLTIADAERAVTPLVDVRASSESCPLTGYLSADNTTPLPHFHSALSSPSTRRFAPLACLHLKSMTLSLSVAPRSCERCGERWVMRSRGEVSILDWIPTQPSPLVPHGRTIAEPLVCKCKTSCGRTE